MYRGESPITCLNRYPRGGRGIGKGEERAFEISRRAGTRGGGARCTYRCPSTPGGRDSILNSDNGKSK